MYIFITHTALLIVGLNKKNIQKYTRNSIQFIFNNYYNILFKKLYLPKNDMYKYLFSIKIFYIKNIW